MPYYTGRNKKPLLESEIRAVNAVSNSCQEAAKKLGVSFETYKVHSKKYGLYDDFKKECKQKSKPRGFSRRVTMEALCAGKHPNYPINYFKERLFWSGLKQRECQTCGYKETRISDGRAPLLITFLDGNKKNWNLENLKILCYNCTFITERNITGNETAKSKQMWWRRCQWERKEKNLDLPLDQTIPTGSVVCNDGMTEPKMGQVNDVDINQTDKITDDELEQLKREAQNELENK